MTRLRQEIDIMYLTSILLPFILAFTTTTSNVNKLPSIELKKLSGESVNLQSYGDNGKVTVISYWATWCSPCKRELDAIADVYPDWQEDYNNLVAEQVQVWSPRGIMLSDSMSKADARILVKYGFCYVVDQQSIRQYGKQVK